MPFLAMPLLQGESLDARLKREGRLPLAEVLRIGRETAEGLAAAHEHGLIHRDVKPANLWLETLPGGRTRVKVLDFGLARASDGDVQLTHSGCDRGHARLHGPGAGAARRSMPAATCSASAACCTSSAPARRRSSVTRRWRS